MKQKTFFFLPVFLILSNFNTSQAQSFHDNKVIAHRGAWKNTGSPQNSIESLNNAMKLGCSGSEFDVRMTKDEVLVINHDPHYKGMDIEKTHYAELLKKPLRNGEPIPTLKSFLKEGKKQRATLLITEIKPSPSGKARSLLLAEKTVNMVRKMRAQNLVVYISFDYDVLRKIRELDKNAKTQYLNGDVQASQLKTDGITGANYHFGIFQKNEKWLEEAQKKRVTTNAWTVNDTLIMDFLLARNIDYLTTDEPEMALKRDSNFSMKSKWKLVWSDEFNYTGLPDSNKWAYDVGGHGWGNRELQYYTEADTANALVKNGILTITAHKEKFDKNDYTSARLLTRDKADWQYGRIEIRAKLPEGRGTWPAIWMLGHDIKEVGWPKCGEIDIMEHVGYEPDSIFGAIHTNAYNHVKRTQKSGRTSIKNPYTEFHTYSLEWTPEQLDFLVDDEVFLSVHNEHKGVDEWPFDKPYYMILNIAVGGNWGGRKGVDDSIFPAKMEVDYVRVFREK